MVPKACKDTQIWKCRKCSNFLTFGGWEQQKVLRGCWSQRAPDRHAPYKGCFSRGVFSWKSVDLLLCFHPDQWSAIKKYHPSRCFGWGWRGDFFMGVFWWIRTDPKSTVFPLEITQTCPKSEKNACGPQISGNFPGDWRGYFFIGVFFMALHWSVLN